MMPYQEYAKTGSMKLSIIIPAYNEARRIAPTLEAIREYAGRTATACELLVVDDGSEDDTAGMVRAFSPEPLTLRVLTHPTNRGKGYSVRRGMLAANGNVLLICDADLSTPIEEVEKLLPWLDRGYNVVIGSRDLSDAVLDPPQPLGRRLAAGAFRAIRRRLLLRNLLDTQCGFKLFRRAAAQDIFSRAAIDGWLFDCEVLGIADRLGYRTKEVGVVWRNDPRSRVRPLREALTALPTLLAIRHRLNRLQK
jgi:dolichyl-phosphate beta-glucosyltransferase